MATTYQLTGITINLNSGTPSVSIRARSVDSVTGTAGEVQKDNIALTSGAQTRVTNLVQDAITYLNNQYPGATFTLPPVPPSSPTP